MKKFEYHATNEEQTEEQAEALKKLQSMFAMSMPEPD
jgi:hypothetical protein